MHPIERTDMVMSRIALSGASGAKVALGK